VRRLALALLLALPARAEEPPARAAELPARAAELPALILRVAVTPPGPVWVGQRVTVTFTAMTPLRFAAPPAFPDLSGLGQAVVLPEASTVPGTERVGSQSYAALQRSIAIFPTAPGDLVLPPLSMRASVGMAAGEAGAATAVTPAALIAVRAPPGDIDLRRLVVAPALRVTATTDRPPEGLHVGEALTRTLRLEADDTAAMLLPPAAWGAPPGLRVYPDPPTLQDRSDRGDLKALRIDRAAYVPQQPGPLRLPGIPILWLDPGSGRIRDMSVAPIEIDVLPVVVTGAPRPVWRRPALLAVGLLFGGALLLAWFWSRRRGGRPQRDAATDLVASCRADDAQAAIAALYRWIDLVLPPAPAGDPGSLAQLSGTPELATEAAALQRRLYGVGITGVWRGAALLSAVRRAGHGLRRQHPAPAGSALPRLNPGSRETRTAAGVTASPHDGVPSWWARVGPPTTLLG
jgi:hypothetical protein